MASSHRKTGPTGRIVFVVGGCRSGKSRFALRLGQSLGSRGAFIATAQALDAEMNRRIQRHKAARPRSWVTYEEPLDLCKVLEKAEGQYDVIVVDCLTLWLSNLIQLGLDQKQLSGRIKELVKTLRRLRTPAILISNEVGLGVIPATSLARTFSDHSGLLHQAVARHAHEVYWTMAGIATRIK